MKHLQTITTLCICAVLATLTWCLLTSNTTPSSTTSPNSNDKVGWYEWKIKVWHLVALDMAPMFIAQEAWFFKDEWLDVETVFFTNPEDNNAALAGGDLQFNINPFTLPFLAQNQWTPMRIISNAWWLGIIQVVIQWDYDINSVADLKAYVAANPGKKLKIGTLKWDTLDMIELFHIVGIYEPNLIKVFELLCVFRNLGVTSVWV